MHVTGLAADAQLRLHFGAVNWNTTVFINGELALTHAGGYDGFSLSLSGVLQQAAAAGRAEYELGAARFELLVHVHNPSEEGSQPNGKGFFRYFGNTGPIPIHMYGPTSGIWQSVWLEQLPNTYISGVRLDADTTTLRAIALIAADAGDTDARDVGDEAEADLLVEARDSGTVDALVTYDVMDADGKRVVSTTQPAGMQAVLRVPSPKLWSPASPHLYDLRVTLSFGGRSADQSGRTAGDSVLSYFGMRRLGKAQAPGSLRTQLNGEWLFLMGWLDQGYWPDGGYTAPTDEALAFDLQAALRHGFNTVRVHEKVNPERW